MISGLYGITDPALLPDQQRLLENVEAALQGGMNILQYRNKTASEEQALRECQALKALCHDYQCHFIVNDNPILAKNVGADGVHLGRDDESFQAARDLLGSKAIIGITCYDQLNRANQAQSIGADYVAFGAFFPSPTKPNATPAPLNLLQQARAALHIPMVAIGGINSENASQLIKHGADAIAVISGLFKGNPRQNAQTFSELFKKYGN